MSTIRVPKRALEDYERCLKSKGEQGLYNSVVGQGFNDRVTIANPELILLNRSEAFFSLYRSSGNEDYFTIGRILRKAAHRLYRQFRRMDEERPVNGRFLYIIKKA